MKIHKTKAASFHAARVLAALSACVAGASAFAQDWFWIGDVSPNWSETNNWNRAADGSGTAPANVDALLNKNLYLQTNGAHPPTNQDIDNFAVNQLEFCKTNSSHMISGKPIQLNYRIAIAGWPAAGFNIDIHNDLAVNSPSEWGTSGEFAAVHLYGDVSGIGANQTIKAGGDGHVHFHMPVSSTKGFAFDSATAHFYGMETLGPAPQEFLDGYFTTGRDGISFHSPNGSYYEYEIDENMGIKASRANGAIKVADNVTALVNGAVSGASPGLTVQKDHGGLLVLNKADILQTRLFINSGLVALNASQSVAEPQHINAGSYSAFDFNGQDLDGFDLHYNGDGGFHGSGLFRSSNRERESRITGDIAVFGRGSTTHFGGAGDIRFEGDITDASVPSVAFRKTGPGTLTLLGTSMHEGPTAVYNGGLVLDYAVTNGNKIGASSKLELTGALKLLGSAEENTIAEIGELSLYARDPHNHISVEARGRGGNSAELRMDAFSYSSDWMANTVDFVLREDNAVKTKTGANNMAAGVMRPNTTFNGETFARFSAAADGDGYFAVEPLPDGAYVPALDPSTDYEFVDVAGAHTNTVAGNAMALRFNSAGASFHSDTTFYLANNSSSLANLASGAILVTPEAGSEPIVIDGRGLLSPNDGGRIYVHHYNSNAPLVIKSHIFGGANGAMIVKTGPGELVLTGATNVFESLRILGGTLTTDDITDAGEYSAAGKMSNASIGNGGTLKYTGPGATARSNIRISGNASIDASGGGALIFTNAINAAGGNEPVIYNDELGNCGYLALTGAGAGEMRGKLNLFEGGLVKTGAGVWTLSGAGVTNSFFNGASVEEGALVVECALGRNVIVKENGAIAGAGFLTHNLRLAGGALAIDASAAHAGRVLTADGNIAIENARLAVQGRFPLNAPVEILRANGAITGEFAGVSDKYRVRYSKNAVQIIEVPTGAMLIVR